jgi:hypothetical protein
MSKALAGLGTKKTAAKKKAKGDKDAPAVKQPQVGDVKPYGGALVRAALGLGGKK